MPGLHTKGLDLIRPKHVLSATMHPQPDTRHPIPEDAMSRNRQLVLFFAAIACMACATGVHDSIFNNFLSDTFSLSPQARGLLEFPRETPGFLVFLTSGILATLPLMRVGTVATLVFSVGMLGIGLLGSSFWPMIAMMCIGSTGLHLLQPVGATLAIGLSDESNRGRRMGQMGAVDTTAAVIGTGLVWLLLDKTAPQYRTGFMCASILGAGAALMYGRMNVPHLHKARPRMVFRMRYRLYYLLELLAGARKQVFLTFGPWVLIKVYNQPATSIAGLLMIAALIGIVFKPMAGAMVDRFGERAVMIADGLVLILVCIGYGYAIPLTGSIESARLLACGCYVADNLLFALSSARAVYLSRVTATPQELTSTLAMGVSINHIASMTIPIGAGALWAGFGYERVFLSAAILALLTSALALRVPAKGRYALAR